MLRLDGMLAKEGKAIRDPTRSPKQAASVYAILAGGQTIGGIVIAVSAPVPEDLMHTAESIWMALSIA